MSDSRDILSRALSWLESGRSVALATVVDTWGSAPRRAGSHMAVSDRREIAGSVSGGCVEGAVVEAAVEAMGDGAPRVLEFGVSDAEAWEVGLACGGKVRVLVEPAGDGRPLDRGELTGLLSALAEASAVVAAVELASGRRLRLARGVETAPPGIGGAGPDAVLEAALAALEADETSVLDAPDGEVLLRPYNPPVRLVVVGAVHVAQPLSRMAALAGLDVTVVDPRRAFATPQRFPDVTLRTEWPGEALEAMALDARSAVVTLTHDPKLDDPALDAALRTDAFYLGALGSRRTHGARLERLRKAGFGDDDLDRIHGPVGLDIGARGAGEIAVAILAELLSVLRGGAAG